jgi:hypothetical protein
VRQVNISLSTVTILWGSLLFAGAPAPSLAAPGLDILGIFGTHVRVEGLDVDGNPIDKLIHEFGSRCLPELSRSLARSMRGRPCRVETEIAIFLESLPQDRRIMIDSLRALGADCFGPAGKPLDCIYRKRVRTLAQDTGEDTPHAITDEIYVFHITQGDSAFRPQVDLTKTIETEMGGQMLPNTSSTCSERLRAFIEQIDHDMESSSSVHPLEETLKRYFPVSECNVEEAISIVRTSKYFYSADDFPQDVVIVLRRRIPDGWGFKVVFGLNRATGTSVLPAAMVDMLK